MKGPLLIIGAGGQLGREAMELAGERGVMAIGMTRAALDITDAAVVARAIEQTQPRLILNAAAYTAVDRAESEPDAARAVNAFGAEAVAQGAALAGVPLVHISTDYVFDGEKRGAYVESDPIAPLGVYGRTKAEGEQRVRAAARQHVILRTAWVFGRHGVNFLKTIMRLARERDFLRVVADQRGSPTATRDIVEATLAVGAAADDGRAAWGTYHFAGPGATTWHEFAEAIVAEQAKITGRSPPVEPIATADYPTAARRPANSELDSSRFAATFGYRARGWRQRAAETVAMLLAEGTTAQ
ncbi:MAG TPA: dTDP-4-dehydrorhamnose reductase [Roseiarcus sp.]|nr:dTDP-4-dehydrorhamnose reductase [Roseiarcus sp.]